jgi:hypothetical protein
MNPATADPRPAAAPLGDGQSGLEKDLGPRLSLRLLVRDADYKSLWRLASRLPERARWRNLRVAINDKRPASFWRPRR